MTIAVCYMSPEGVVLGADSTSSVSVSQSGFHYFNNNQKLYELGEEATLGVVTWGLGGLGHISHRTLLAILADDLKANPPADVADIANRWAGQFGTAYSTSPMLAPAIQICQALSKKNPYDANAPTPAPDARTKDEENQYQQLKLNLVVGFCIAGYVLPDRTPAAFEILFDPLGGQPTPLPIPALTHKYWGAPNIIMRLIFGADPTLRNQILTSGKWNGTEAELDAIISQQKLDHPVLPIRDAIDYVHACIYSTIKAMKFSNLSQICGGPIELAVITSDRRFRWVRHKDWDSAVLEGA